MFRWFKGKETTPSKALIMDEMIGSKSVRVHKEETYEVALPASASDAMIAEKLAVLRKYAELIGYPNPHINKRYEDEWLILWFAGPTTTSGTDFNPMVFGNITWVEDLI